MRWDNLKKVVLLDNRTKRREGGEEKGKVMIRDKLKQKKRKDRAKDKLKEMS